MRAADEIEISTIIDYKNFLDNPVYDEKYKNKIFRSKNINSLATELINNRIADKRRENFPYSQKWKKLAIFFCLSNINGEFTMDKNFENQFEPSSNTAGNIVYEILSVYFEEFITSIESYTIKKTSINFGEYATSLYKGERDEGRLETMLNKNLEPIEDLILLHQLITENPDRNSMKRFERDFGEFPYDVLGYLKNIYNRFNEEAKTEKEKDFNRLFEEKISQIQKIISDSIQHIFNEMKQPIINILYGFECIWLDYFFQCTEAIPPKTILNRIVEVFEEERQDESNNNQKIYNLSMIQGNSELLTRFSRIFQNILGRFEEFNTKLAEYKEELGKDFQNLFLFSCSNEEEEEEQYKPKEYDFKDPQLNALGSNKIIVLFKYITTFCFEN